MAKKSKKRPSRQGREYPGCVPSLLDTFDFRCGRSTIRLLPDRRPSIRITDGNLSNGNGTVVIGYGEVLESKEDSQEKEKPMPENDGISVKELVEVEMISEGGVLSLPGNSHMNSVSEIHSANCLIETRTFDKLAYETTVETPNLPHRKPENSKTDGYSRHKHQNFFRGRSRSLESFLEGGDEDCHSSSVVPSIISCYMHDKEKDERFASSRFSFTELKRKLWHALGKDKTVISRNHFYSERFILSTEKNGELKDNGNDSSRCQKLGGGFNLYVEAKKHIYEMLKDADEDSDPVIKKLPKSLGMILDAPDPTVEVLENLSSIGNQSGAPGTVSREIGDTAQRRPEEVGDIIEAAYESHLSPMDADFQHFDTSFHKICLKSDLIGEDQMLSPAVSSPQSPVTSGAEGCKSEHSPVSVLDSSFMDDAISPASTSSQPVMEMERQHVNFKEQSPACNQGIVCRRISMENEESPFEYVEAVLLGSGLNWDDFHSRWLASREILDSPLFEEVELFSTRSRHDQHLLFDSANEALIGLCDVYFGKETIQQIPGSMSLIDQIWRWIEWHLLRHTETNSMDRLIQFDLARSGKWMNLHRHIELISFEIEVTIFDELMEEITISFQEVRTEDL